MVRSVRRTRATVAARNRIPQETKLLVVHLKPFLRHVLNQMRANLEKTLDNNTSMIVFRECFRVNKFRETTIKMIESGEMLHFLLSRRTQYRNFAKLIKYMNRFINIVYNPELIVSGYWTRQVIVQRQDPLEVKQEDEEQQQEQGGAQKQKQGAQQ